ncbi:MAG: FAD-binding protein [Fusobacteriaceae bacterium]|jgi:aspartate oxidase|nr:FAD-binding protein [Fusobacteriaceae bacterium]
MGEKEHEVIIIGMGLAALAAAARLLELGIRDIGIYAKSWGGTPFIAAINFVLPENPYGDTSEQYFKDMIAAGYRIGNKELVRDMTDHTLAGYELLRRWGVKFAENANRTKKLRHVSGHTFPRSLCSTEDLIGLEILKKMTKEFEQKGLHPRMNAECVSLLAEDGKICGITVLDSENRPENIYAPIVIAAWGGVGNLFGTSTYPPDIQGNTLAIAKKAGATLVDLEFLEYEPMVVMDPPGALGEPCPTAMLGEGGHLLNSKEERFLLRVRPQGEGGAPKTLINKQIWKEVAAGNGTPHGGVWVDLRHIDQEILEAYPWFYNRLVKNGLDPKKQLVEVGPMAHSFSGGILVDRDYQSNIKGLFAVGEACGGLHGACRCAGNAASQAVISGLLCAEAIDRQKNKVSLPGKVFSPFYASNQQIFDQYAPGIRSVAAKALGIYRDGTILSNAKAHVDAILQNEEIQKDTRTVQIAMAVSLMLEAAIKRKESRGTHMRLDFPEESPEFEREFTI